MNHVDRILMEIDRYDIRYKDEWNPLHNPNATSSKPNIQLDDGRPYWFDSKSPQVAVPPGRLNQAIEDIKNEIMARANESNRATFPSSVAKFFNYTVKAISKGGLDGDEFESIKKICPTITTMYLELKRLYKNLDLDRANQFASIIARIFDSVAKSIHVANWRNS